MQKKWLKVFVKIIMLHFCVDFNLSTMPHTISNHSNYWKDKLGGLFKELELVNGSGSENSKYQSLDVMACVIRQIGNQLQNCLFCDIVSQMYDLKSNIRSLACLFCEISQDVYTSYTASVGITGALLVKNWNLINIYSSKSQ